MQRFLNFISTMAGNALGAAAGSRRRASSSKLLSVQRQLRTDGADCVSPVLPGERGHAASGACTHWILGNLTVNAVPSATAEETITSPSCARAIWLTM